MLITIPHVLSTQQLTVVNAWLDEAPFVDGKLSAGAVARQVKHNQEVDRAAADLLDRLNDLVMGNLVRHPQFRNAVLPHRIATPFYARYTAGMGYGDHIDDPVMGSPNHYRSDVSTTVFLNGPEAYEGGELVIRTTYGEHSVKLPAGHAVVYPSTSLHRVAEVRSGERRVAVTWTQSLIRDAARRELLYELSLAREKMLRKQPEAAETRHIDHVYVNLVRMWAEV